MRNYINLIKLFETAPATQDELESMKAVIAGKIKQLPPDAETAKALREIEDLLSHLHAGGRMGIVSKELDSIADPTVTAAQKMLSRYILSLDMTPDQRNQLFTLWREDKLVKRNKLLETGKKTINDVIEAYDTNPAIKEFVDDLMQVAALGQGKGEFAFSVLSKSIAKPQKGDLVVDGTKVEVKTTEGGAGRFTDQEVRPGEGFERAARNLNTFVSQELAKIGANPLPKSGLSLSYACQIAPKLGDQERKQFVQFCQEVINIIFDSTDSAAAKRIGSAIDNGNANTALQEYAKLSFNYYMGKKEDDGVLYINLTKKPTMLVWFKDADDLAASGLRLHAGTVYITSIADIRLPYPQMEIVDTQGGGSMGGASPEQTAASIQKQADISQKIQDVAARKPISGLRPKRSEGPREKR